MGTQTTYSGLRAVDAIAKRQRQLDTALRSGGVARKKLLMKDTLLELCRSIPESATGVYALINRVSWKVYVGSSAKSLTNRLNNHVSILRGSYHPNDHLQKSWNKYGEKVFALAILERCEPAEYLRIEQKWIDLFQSFKGENGYNKAPHAGNSLGVKLPPLTAKHKARISATSKLWWRSPEYRQKMSEASKRRWAKPGEKDKMRAMLAELYSDEAYMRKKSRTHKRVWKREGYRQNLIQKRREYWAKEENRAAHSARITVARRTERAKVNATAAMKKLWRGKKYRAKLLESRRSEANRKRMSEQSKRMWADPDRRAKLVASHRSEEYKQKYASIRAVSIKKARKSSKATYEARFDALVRPLTQQIVSRYTAGEGAVHIVRDLDITYQSLYRILKENGVKKRTMKEMSLLTNESRAEKVRQQWDKVGAKERMSVAIKAGMARGKSVPA